VEIGVLGPVGVWSAGSQVDTGSARELCILAILALTPRVRVPAEALIDRVWGQDPPPKAREDLSSYVTRIRKHLRRATDLACLETASGGYLLSIDPEAIDVHLFRLKQRQSRALADSGDLDGAVRLLREADALWRGEEALAGLAGDWALRMRQSLGEERRAAIMRRVELELQQGHHADLVSELQRLCSQDPLDETATGYLMTALYRSGRVTESLDTYQDARRRLQHEGMEPGLELSGLQQQILRRDPALAIARDKSASPAPPNTLLPAGAIFVGRTAEVRLLTTPGAEAPPAIKVIEGMPGVGKTALALHIAHGAAARLTDAQLYLNLHAHDAEHGPLRWPAAADRLLQMLGVPGGDIPAVPAERAALWRNMLASRRAVVVLDDVPGADSVAPLLPTAGDSLVLLTSRRRLRTLKGATVLALDTLSAEDAASLLIQVAGAAKCGDTKAVSEAARLCGFLPLAIEVAAANLRHGNPATLPELVQELGHPRAWTGPAAAMPAQVRSAFDLSYRNLAPSQQQTFRLLSVHPCPEITPHAAAALTGTTLENAATHLEVLADHHLLQARAPGRFGWHDLARDYALSSAMAHEDGALRRQAAGRVLDYYLCATDQADRALYPFRRRRVITVVRVPDALPDLATAGQAQAWMQAERLNIIHAARYAAAHEWKQKCADLAHGIAGFLENSGYWHEAAAIHQLAVDAARDLRDSGRTAQAELELAHASQYAGHYRAAASHVQRAAAIYRGLGDLRGEAEAIDRAGTIHGFRSRFLGALAYYDEAESLYQASSDLHGVADTRAHAGISYEHLGRYPEAVRNITRALALYRRAGDRRGEARALANLGELQRRQGYHRDAMTQYRESLRIYQEIGGSPNEAEIHQNIGMIQHYKGHYDQALASYRAALGAFRRLGDQRNQAAVLGDIGAAYQSQDLHSEALAHYQEAKAIAADLGDRFQLTIALRGMGDARAGTANYSLAGSHYQDALRLAREMGDPYQEAKTITSIAETALQAKGPDTARIYFRQALAIFERLGVPETEETRIRLEVLAELTARRPASLP
jgi:DNA-binding SARP family transcriptional activator